MKYTYDSIYENVKALGLLGVTSTTFTFTATWSIDLTKYQKAVMLLDFKGFQDQQFESKIDAVAADPSIDVILGISKDGNNAHIPDSSDANIAINADRVIINAKDDFSMLFGQEGVAIASPDKVNIDSGRSITLFGHQNVFLGIPNKGNPIVKNTKPPATKGDPTRDSEYEPLVLGIKLANLVKDILYVLKSADLVSGVSPVKFQPHTQAEFGLLANRVPEILSEYAYVDGYSHSEVNQKALKDLKEQQKKTVNYTPPAKLEGTITGTATGTPGTGGPQGGADYTPVANTVVPTATPYVTVAGGHGAYWPNNFNTVSQTKDPKLGAGEGDNFHSFTSDIGAHPGRTMDIQVEKALKFFKDQHGKPADIVGMFVVIDPNAQTKQVQWEVLIQESKDGIHYANFTTRGGASGDVADVVRRSNSQINEHPANKPGRNFKKIFTYLLDKPGTSLKVNQIFAIYP